MCGHWRGSCCSPGAVCDALAGLGSPRCHPARSPGPAEGVGEGEDGAAALPSHTCGEMEGTGAVLCMACSEKQTVLLESHLFGIALGSFV